MEVDFQDDALYTVKCAQCHFAVRIAHLHQKQVSPESLPPCDCLVEEIV